MTEWFIRKLRIKSWAVFGPIVEVNAMLQQLSQLPCATLTIFLLRNVVLPDYEEGSTSDLTREKIVGIIVPDLASGGRPHVRANSKNISETSASNDESLNSVIAE
jgi:hypothetical protein